MAAVKTTAGVKDATDTEEKIEAVISRLVAICRQRQAEKLWGRLTIELLWEEGWVKNWRLVPEETHGPR